MHGVMLTTVARWHLFHGEPRLALSLADSGMRLISASDGCSAREYRAGRVMAGAYLAIGDTARAEAAFVAASTPQVRGEWTDSARVALGSRFDQARWDAAVDSSARVTRRCSETRSLEWQARRTMMKRRGR